MRSAAQIWAAAGAALVLAAGLALPGGVLGLACWVQSPAAVYSALLHTAAQAAALPAGGAAPEQLGETSGAAVSDGCLGSGDSGTLPLPAATPAPPADPAAALPYVPLWADDRRPADALAVVEKTYGSGSGDNILPLTAGSIKNNTRVSADAALAAAAAGLPFAVQLHSDQPQVLIMHTHATESYRRAAGLWVPADSTFRSTDRAWDLCAVGAVMADTLNKLGICTLHDTTLNDYPSYTGSYDNSRAVVQQYLAQYPSIRVVLDVHRDAIEANGSPVAAVTEINGRKAAQVMLISGCDNGGSVKLPHWRQNLAFAAAWQAQMEADYPGLTRPVLFSYRFYNQDLTTGSLLLEVGSHGNNLNEAIYSGYLAATALAEILGA